MKSKELLTLAGVGIAIAGCSSSTLEDNNLSRTINNDSPTPSATKTIEFCLTQDQRKAQLHLLSNSGNECVSHTVDAKFDTSVWKLFDGRFYIVIADLKSSQGWSQYQTVTSNNQLIWTRPDQVQAVYDVTTQETSLLQKTSIKPDGVIPVQRLDNLNSPEIIQSEILFGFGPFVNAYKDDLIAVASQFNIDPNILAAISTVESYGYLYAQGASSDSGAFQIIPSTWAGFSNKINNSPDLKRMAQSLGLSFNPNQINYHPREQAFIAALHIAPYITRGPIPSNPNNLDKYLLNLDLAIGSYNKGDPHSTNPIAVKYRTFMRAFATASSQKTAIPQIAQEFAYARFGNPINQDRVKLYTDALNSLGYPLTTQQANASLKIIMGISR